MSRSRVALTGAVWVTAARVWIPAPLEWPAKWPRLTTAASRSAPKAPAAVATALFTFTSSPRCPLSDAERVPAEYRPTGQLAKIRCLRASCPDHDGLRGRAWPDPGHSPDLR